MHTALKVPSMGVPQCFLKSGCRRSAQQTGWSGGLFSLGPVSGRGGVGWGGGRAQLAPPQQLRVGLQVYPSPLAPLNGKLGLEN